MNQNIQQQKQKTQRSNAKIDNNKNGKTTTTPKSHKK